MTTNPDETLARGLHPAGTADSPTEMSTVIAGLDTAVRLIEDAGRIGPAARDKLDESVRAVFTRMRGEGYPDGVIAAVLMASTALMARPEPVRGVNALNTYASIRRVLGSSA